MISDVWVSYPLKQGLKRKISTCGGVLWRVWVSYPLKQGLKPVVRFAVRAVISGLSQLSIKTRIETLSPLVFVGIGLGLSQLSIKTRIETRWCITRLYDCASVWVSYPLKQGLKLLWQMPKKLLSEVWVSYPLKQGLKRLVVTLCLQQLNSLSQLSIKTRIETQGGIRWQMWELRVWVSYPLKQGLKHISDIKYIVGYHLFESAIH